MLERIALDGMEGAELLALNTDVRTLAACVAREKIQLGVNLTKGLGAGGDPELGHQAMLESEDQIRQSIKGRRIVFLCAGLGGGTGSGAAPIVTRIAREEGAFVVVFATMPFAFEGRRRREQAETALNELAVLSNALVTFDNNRMGELVLAKQGIHEAFAAADHMICESIKAVIRLVIRPGLINVGLDDLMSALRTNRSRCLFGSGISNGKDRATKALRNALSSPLLDQGALLKDAQTVLVHLSGGEDLTLFEIELLMQRLQKFVPDKAHVLFGAAVDPAMGDSLSITLISALPEDFLAAAPRESISHRAQESPILDPSQGFTSTSPSAKIAALVAEMLPEEEEGEPAPAPAPAPKVEPKPEPVVAKAPAPQSAVEKALAPFIAAESPREPVAAVKPTPEPSPVSPLSKFRKSAEIAAATPSLFDEERPFAEPDFSAKPRAAAATPVPTPAPAPQPEPVEETGMDAFTFTDEPAAKPVIPQAEDEEEAFEFHEPEQAPGEKPHVYGAADEPDPEPIESEDIPDIEPKRGTFVPGPKRRPFLTTPWGKSKAAEFPDDIPEEEGATLADVDEAEEEEVPVGATASPDGGPPKLKLGVKSSVPQSELSLDSAPRGRFEGESPNVVDGEDLDLPPFLRKKK